MAARNGVGDALRSAALAFAVASGCAAPQPTTPSLTPSALPTLESGPRISLPEPGRPYSGPDILAFLTEATPDRVPHELVRPEVADALAEQVWTFDGRPYRAVAVGADCDAIACHLSLQGAPATDNPEARNDAYRFDVDPDSLVVTPQQSDLAALPAELNPQLDAMARAAVPAERLHGLAYVSATWLPPPEFGRFELTYDDGGLEGSRALEVLVDARLGAVIIVRDVLR